MTRKKLFPQDTYPVRKRTEFVVPSKKVRFYMELYFEKTDTEFGGQFIGEYIKVSSLDGTVAFSSAKLIFPDLTMVYYTERNGGFTIIPTEKIAILVKAFERKFKKKYRVSIADRQMDINLDVALTLTKWESF